MNKYVYMLPFITRLRGLNCVHEITLREYISTRLRCMPGSLTSGFLWSRWWGKRPRHSRPMRNSQSYISDRRPIATQNLCCCCICWPEFSCVFDGWVLGLKTYKNEYLDYTYQILDSNNNELIKSEKSIIIYKSSSHLLIYCIVLYFYSVI